MPTISIVKSDPMRAVIWASVFAVNDLHPARAGNFIFEILAEDGEALYEDIGQKRLMSADGGQVFWGELISLTPSASTVPALALMRGRPVLLGVLRIYPDSGSQPN